MRLKKFSAESLSGKSALAKLLPAFAGAKDNTPGLKRL